MRQRLSALALLLVGAAGCDRSASSTAGNASTGGTLVVAAASDADILFPPLVAGVQGKQVVDLVFDHLAAIGPELNTVGDAGFTPQLARRWQWADDSLSIAFELDPQARWHDGTPVRAADVRFTHALMTDSVLGSPHAGGLAGVDSVTVRDSTTAVAWFARRSPEQFFDLVFNMAILPSHLLAKVPTAELRTSEFARKPVGSGRFRFARWDAGSRIELVADTANYRGAPALSRVVWSVSPDYAAATTRLVAGEADYLEGVRGDAVERVAATADLRTVSFPSLDYGYMAFNFRDARDHARPNALFADRGVRRALSMALDRPAMVKNVLDTLGLLGIGPVTRAQTSADPSIAMLPYDTSAATRLLDSLGWRDANGDGVRERGGRKLEFSLLVPTSSAPRMRMAVLIQDQLKQVGVAVRIESVEANVFFERVQAHKFDAMLNAWRTDPSPAGVRQAWGSASADAGNFGSYASPRFDALVDSAAAEFDPARSKALYRRAYAQIVDDAPAVWLYELRNVAAVHRRFDISGLRADAWWAGLAGWSVPDARRIPRDRIPLQVTQR
jgi:peptide/nickel transport system substrate-binding protein